MALPNFTPEERAKALEKAAQVRKARKELKENIKSGETDPASGDCKMYVDDNNYGHSPCYYHLRILLFSCHGEKAKVRTAARFLRVGFALSKNVKNRHHKTDAGSVKIA